METDKTLSSAVAAIGADVMAFQEVDHFLPRSKSRPQIRDIAESIGARDWAMGPSVIGTPGENWRKKHDHEPEIITDKSSHAELMHECYGIAIASRIPVLSWHRFNIGRSPLGLPLIVPSDETGKGKPRFLYVKDEPRLALAAVLENGFTVVNTHLSFVPPLNLRQLRRVKKWALHLAEETGTRAIVLGDLNLPFETVIAGILIRGRIDAVYKTDTGFEVVDWKTGSKVLGESSAVQLAVYRLAWAKLQGISVDQVSAAFHYVPTNTTDRRANLLSEAELIALLSL